MDHEMEVVSSIRLAIAERIGSERYELWISETELSFANGALRVASARPFSLEWIRANFRRDLKAACKEVVGTEADLQFCIDESLPTSSTSPAIDAKATDKSPQPTKTSQSSATNERPSNLHVGDTSRAARRFASLSTWRCLPVVHLRANGCWKKSFARRSLEQRSAATGTSPLHLPDRGTIH
jgi:chromosomal replication initiation ATPase DnaA